MNADSPTHPIAPPDDPLAARLRGFGPTGLVAIAVVLAGNFLFAPLSALLALAWARRSRTPFAVLGFAALRHPVATILVAIVLGGAFKLVMKALVMPLLGAPPVNAAYHFLAGNSAALPGMIFTIVVAAGFGEEVVFRGYFFERLGALLGRSSLAQAAMVVLTAALFGVAHAPEQGLPGVQQATVVGLVFGAIYARTRRVVPLMVAHTAFDLVAVSLIYFEWEEAVARALFR